MRRPDLRFACAVALSTLACGCAFGRHYDASYPQSLVLADESTLASQPVAADGGLPLEYCRKACGEDAYEKVRSCHVATLGVRAAPTQLARVPAPSVGAKFLHCGGYIPAGSDLTFR